MRQFSLSKLFHSGSPKKPRLNKTTQPIWLPAVTALCAAAIFVADTITTTDIAFATFYTAVVLLAARFCSARGIIGVGVGCEALTLIAYHISPPGGPELGGIVNTAIGLAAIGLTTFLVVHQTAAEASLREAEERLRHSEKMSALGQLASGMAHDFRNVLQVVQGGAEVIAARPLDEERVRRFAASILSTSHRGLAITQRLLIFSRVGELRTAPVDAGALISELREILGHTLGRTITVRTEIMADLPPMLADKDQLVTVLINLATNARDAMPDGGTISLSAALETVASRGEAFLKPGCYLLLSVADTGTGMDAATLAKARQAFFTTKPAEKGTGLGLPMAQSFAEQSGGGLHIESAPGRGTAVKLWIPVAGETDGNLPPATQGHFSVPSGAGPPPVRRFG